MLNRKALVSSLALLITAGAAHAGGVSGSTAGTSNPINQLDRPAVTRQVAPRIVSSTGGPASPSNPTGSAPLGCVLCALPIEYRPQTATTLGHEGTGFQTRFL